MSPPSSSLPPAGVPDSGGAKYAVIAIVLVLAAGGLFAWRSLGNRADGAAAGRHRSVADHAAHQPED